MKTFKELVVEMVNSVKPNTPKVGSQTSFVHHTGKTVKGTYKGKAMMGGKSYHKVDDGKEAHYIPTHTKLS